MITIPATNINEVTITGQVISMTYYADHNKFVFTMKNTVGKYYVEFQPVIAKVGIYCGASVMVSGSLFSSRAGKIDVAKIRARLVHIMNFEDLCGVHRIIN